MRTIRAAQPVLLRRGACLLVWAACAALLVVLPAHRGSARTPRVTLTVESARIAPAVPESLQYGGGVWHVPKVFDWVEPEIFALKRLGTFRAALAWEVLAASRDRAHLRRLLEGYRLNGFLARVRDRGGRVVISLDAMPRWLARNQSERRLPDGPEWARSAPADLDRWADVVADVVAHFNGRLKLDAFYEIWNEPDHAFLGTLSDYFALYRASVAGARRADAEAKVGGPAISDWTALGTRQDRLTGTEPLFLQAFVDYAARTALPALGLQRLPVDFITWHGFYRNPATHYDMLVPRVRNWAREAGYPDVPLIVDEWNIAAVPPYPEGDLNGTHVGAAYVGATLIAMNRAGIDRQVFQMMVDPGAEGYSGGTFTPYGIPRPNFQTYRLFGLARGAQQRVSTSDPWVFAAAFQEGARLVVLCSVFVPTERMFLRGQFEPLAAQQPQLRPALERLAPGPTRAYVTGNGAMPGGVSPEVQAILKDARQAWRNYDAKRREWQNGITLAVNVPGGQGAGSTVLHYALDASQVIGPEEIRRTQEQMAAMLRSGMERAQAVLNTRSVPEAQQRQFFSAVKEKLHVEPVLSGVQHDNVDAMRRAYEEITGAFARARQEVARGWHERAMKPERLETRPNGPLQLEVRPYSMHVLVLGP